MSAIKSISTLAVIGVFAYNHFHTANWFTDMVGGIDPSTVTCTDSALINHVKALSFHSVSEGSYSILEVDRIRKSDTYSPRNIPANGAITNSAWAQGDAEVTHQCKAVAETERGTKLLYYGWKVMNGKTLIIASLLDPGIY